MTHAGAIYVSRGMKEHTNEQLRDLDMGYNEIKDEGACALAQVWHGLLYLYTTSLSTCHCV